jgi:hypothetical protein
MWLEREGPDSGREGEALRHVGGGREDIRRAHAVQPVWRCRASTRSGGDGPRKRCCRPAINSASACPGQCRCWVRRQPIGPAYINLTTVSQNTQQQAEHAVAAAVERLDEQCSAPHEVVLSPRLAIRRTAASTPLVWLITPREIAVGGSGQPT